MMSQFDLSIRRTRDVWSSLVCLAVGILFTLGSIQYGDVRGGVPSAGLFPFIGGLMLMGLSVLHLIILFRRKAENTRQKFFPQPYSARNIALVLISLFAYQTVLKYAGFLVVTCAFMMFLLKAVKAVKWITAVCWAVTTAGLSYLLFEVWLQVQLPSGILWRWADGILK